ncbi:MAG TPA: AEC family transporter [Kofleriaceae bacterium]
MHAWLHAELEIGAWVILPILFGVVLGRFGLSRRAASGLFAFSLYGCQTVVIVSALWIARIHAEARILPVLALSGWLLAALFAWIVSRKLSGESPKRGAFIISMSMSNNGFTLLGFIALALFGEAGLAQASYAQLFYVPFFLLFCFPIARIFGRSAQRRPLGALLRENAVDPRVWVPLLAIGCGLVLNGVHVARPAVVSQVARVLVFLGTIGSSCAIGLLFSGFHLRRYWRENLISFLYRCTLYPLFYWGLARWVGLGSLDTTILVLYGLVPSALLTSLLAVFFELDTDLTSSMFLVSTALFVVFVLPVFAIATQ